jgi:hypothetical protein
MKTLLELLYEIINEIEIDGSQDHLKFLKKLPQSKLSIPFTIKDKEYEFIVIETEIQFNVKVASFYFKNITAMKSIKKGEDEPLDSYSARIQNSKLGITGTGDSMHVFSKVVNIFVAYLEKYNPTFIHFFAVEENRKKLYKKIFQRLQQKTKIRMEPQILNPIDGEKLQDNEFVYKISMSPSLEE